MSDSKSFSDKLRFIFIELPAFTKEEEKCITDFERWIYVLKNMKTLNRLPFKARKAVFEKLEKIIDIASLTKEEREKYDESIKVYRDQLVTIAFAKEKAVAAAVSEAKKRGALGELTVHTQVNPQTAFSKEGVPIDLGTTVTASATGRIEDI